MLVRDHQITPPLIIIVVHTRALAAPPAGQLLREAVEDLEWPGGAVEVVLQQDPPRLILAASGHGALEVRRPAGGSAGEVADARGTGAGAPVVQYR